MDAKDGKKNINVLIVEDSRLDATLLIGLIKKSRLFHFEMKQVTRGSDALEYLSEHSVDLVLLDLGLPDSTGEKTLDSLLPHMRKVPVIVLTGDDDIELASKALRSGAQDYLVKGRIDFNTMEKAIPYALDRHRLREERDRNLLSMQEATDRTNRMLGALDKSHERLEREIAKGRLLTTAIEQSVETVVITDTNGTIVYANKSFEDVTGYSIDEAVGQNPRILKSGLHGDPFYQELWAALKTTGKWSGRLKNRKKDGTVYEEEARISSVTNETGEVVNYVAVKKDVSHESALELQLMQARKLESIGQLAAGIAHEINTPSQYVGDNIRFLQEATDGFLKILKKYEELSDTICPELKEKEMFKALQEAKEEVDLGFLVEETPTAISQSLDGIERISQIVLAMKEFSHPGTEKMTVNDINRALMSTITVASNEWKHVAEMETKLGSGLPLIPCFMGEMNQVFLNIIVNAAHAIEEANNGNGKISVVTSLEEPFFRIDISDNGNGIPDEIKDKIFDPFFTTKDVGKGTGQGLAMAFNTVIEKHHGKLMVDSQVGEGTTFTILLPQRQIDKGEFDAE